MTEYIERDKALRAIDDEKHIIGGSVAEDMLIALNLASIAVQKTAAADVVPVVRCIECDKATSKDGHGAVFCRLFKMPMNEQGYCSCGEKDNEGGD